MKSVYRYLTLATMAALAAPLLAASTAHAGLECYAYCIESSEINDALLKQDTLTVAQNLWLKSKLIAGIDSSLEHLVSVCNKKYGPGRSSLLMQVSATGRLVLANPANSCSPW